MKNTLRILSMVLLLITGINALIAGLMFVISPSGEMIGMTTEYLQFSPFTDYLIPGIILFSVNGVLNILAAVFVIMKRFGYPYWILIQGILLCGWIVVQVILVKDLNFLQITMYAIGLILIICGWLLGRFAKNLGTGQQSQ